jgi:hypothetical protein
MSALERISEMLRLANTRHRIFPPTVFYNEGWLLRLVLDWFSQQRLEEHPLCFASDAKWFSEALLPSHFFARQRGDKLAEGWTHADGVVGHVMIGDAALANTKLLDHATQFIVTEAKLFSPLSSGVRNASYFDQAARNVACVAEVLCRALQRPEELTTLSFLVIAPSEQVSRKLFSNEISKDSIKSKVSRRIAEYPLPDREKKEEWQHNWFFPTLLNIKIDILGWEEIINFIRDHDSIFGSELSEFYSECLKVNRLQEPDRRIP